MSCCSFLYEALFSTSEQYTYFSRFGNGQQLSPVTKIIYLIFSQLNRIRDAFYHFTSGKIVTSHYMRYIILCLICCSNSTLWAHATHCYIRCNIQDAKNSPKKRATSVAASRKYNIWLPRGTPEIFKYKTISSRNMKKIRI